MNSFNECYEPSAYRYLPTIQVYNPSDNVSRVQFMDNTEPLDLTLISKVEIEIYSGFSIDTDTTPQYIVKADQTLHLGVIDLFLGRIPQLSQRVYNCKTRLYDSSVPKGTFFGFIRANVYTL